VRAGTGAPGKPRTPNLLIFNGCIWPESCHSVFMILLVTPSEKASECVPPPCMRDW